MANQPEMLDIAREWSHVVTALLILGSVAVAGLFVFRSQKPAGLTVVIAMAFVFGGPTAGHLILTCFFCNHIPLGCLFSAGVLILLWHLLKSSTSKPDDRTNT